jgi:hypothetical protein
MLPHLDCSQYIAFTELCKSFQLYSETRDIRTIGIEDITDECLKPNEMLFLNWQTINRDDTLFMREGEDGKAFTTSSIRHY